MLDPELRLELSATEALIPAAAADLGNPSWEGAQPRILILRLSPFRDIEGSTSHLLLFAECRRALPRAFIDFGFFPDARDRSILHSQRLSLFYGLASGKAPADFNLILVSNAFSLELLNLGYLFSGSGLPRRASGRAMAALASPIPIVILGGSNAAAAGSLLFPGAPSEEESDSLVDGIFFGEGEGAIGSLAVALTEPGLSRAERLERASAVEGFWRARSGKRAARRILRPFPPHLKEYPILNSEGASTARLQISAGCPGFCSFCLEGWESRPYREFPLADILKAARELKAATGASSLEIYSYNFNTHAAVFELIFELNRIFRRVNFMSQRLDILADSPSLAAAELSAGKRSFTLGIEGISERMRAYYRKGIDEAQIDEAIGRLALPAVRELKLFYILAGTEDDRDIGEFAVFAARTAETRRRLAPGQRIIVSAGYLARLPFTPLQHAPLCLERDRIESITRRIEGLCAAAGIEFRLAVDFEEYYTDQLLALGGRALAPWLELCPEAGICYDSGLSRGTGAALEAFASTACEGGGLLDEAFLGEKPEGWRPPLAFIDGNDQALWKNYLLASSFAPKEGLMKLPPNPDGEWLRRLEALMAAKRDLASTLVRLSLPRSLVGARAEYRASWVMRAISASSPDRGTSVFDAEEALFSKGGCLEGMAEDFWGLSYFFLRGPDPRRMEKSAMAAGFELAEGLPACDPIAAELEIPARFAPEAEATLKAWLAEERVDFIETREAGSGPTPCRRLKATASSARKRMLMEALLEGPDPATPDGTLLIRLSLGRKACLASWISRMGRAARRSAALRFLSY
jgi:radical SAM superfamily enzyme YgiQ (UPF0313 family)